MLDAKPVIEHAGREAQAMAWYLGLSYWADLKGLPFLASWARVSSAEERTHMQAFLSYVNDYLDVKADHPGVSVMSVDPKDITDALTQALDLEERVTGWLVNLHEMAYEAGDAVLCAFLQPFLRDQISTVSDLRSKLALVKSQDSIGDYLFAEVPASDPAANAGGIPV